LRIQIAVVSWPPVAMTKAHGVMASAVAHQENLYDGELPKPENKAAFRGINNFPMFVKVDFFERFPVYERNQ
jgi:hypothetical protein